jgi:ubiquilin
MTITLTIRLSTSARFTIPSPNSPPITTSTTILQVKQLISQHEDSGRVEVARQRLIYKGRILSEDEKTLGEYGIQEGGGETVLYLVKGSAPASTGGSGGTPASAPTPAANTNTTSAPAPNPFAAFGNMSQMGSMPSMQQMQEQLQSNPEFMSQLMNNPMVQSLMSNPDFMSNMMESNPQMQQILNSNPELRHALRDPEMMRRSMEMMRDPSMMQQMMRNQDLAMSQIENMPGGYNALRRMYEDVQVPMMDAMTGGEQSASSEGGGGGQQNRGGAQNQAMPNPWGSSGGASTANTSNAQSGANPAGGMFNPFAMPNMGAGGANPWAAGAGSTQQLEATIQMLENPMMRQMMDQMMANPEAVRGMMVRDCIDTI